MRLFHYRNGGVRWAAAAVAAVAAAAWAAPQKAGGMGGTGGELAPAVTQGPWVRPAATLPPASPVWGHAEGLRVGLAPMAGPRGLLRVYAPYLGQSEEQMINYVAVEPVPAGKKERGLSELEQSRLDGVRGKRFWSTDEAGDGTPRNPCVPARGKVVKLEDGVEALRVYVGVEPFENGAHVYLRLTFRADRPYEVGIATFAATDSVALDRCIVTATMGNYARLRELHLAGRVVRAADLWPGFSGAEFAPHARFGAAELAHTADGDAIASATPDEERPEEAKYAAGTRAHWHYRGAIATQYWRTAERDPGLVAQVNGRCTYWASQSPIPGGIAFENFEMVSPFHQGAEFWFGVTPGVGKTVINKPVIRGQREGSAR